MLELRLISIEATKPFLGGRENLPGRSRSEFDTGAVTGPVFGLLQQIEEFIDGLPRDFGGLQQRPAFVVYPIDPAMRGISVRITEVVLHVSDDRVDPVQKIDRAIGADLEVGGTEHRVGGRKHGFFLGARETCPFIVDPVSENALEPDHIADQEIPLPGLGKVAARERLDARARPGSLSVNLRRSGVLRGVIEMTREEGRMVRNRSRAVGDDVLTPSIEGVPVGVGEAVRDIDLELLRTRLIPKDTGVGVSHGPAIGCLHLSMVEGTFLEV